MAFWRSPFSSSDCAFCVSVMPMPWWMPRWIPLNWGPRAIDSASSSFAIAARVASGP